MPLTLMMAASSPLYGQFSIGVTAGPGNASVSGDTPKDAKYKGRLGFVGGVIAEYGFQSDVRLSLQPGFSQGGTTIAFDVPGTEDETRDSVAIELGYVNLPVLLRVVTDGGGWYVTGGPYFAFLQAADGTYEGGETQDISDLIESMDAGAVFGVGHFIPIGPIDAYIELRFVQGLTNLNSQPDQDIRFRNGSRQLLFGLLYQFGP